MRWLQDLSVAKKIYLLVSIAIVGILAVGGSALWSTTRLASTSVNVGRTQLPAVRNMTLCDMMHDGLLACVYRTLLAGQESDENALAGASAEYRDFATNFDGYVRAIDKLELRPETRAAIQSAKPDISEYVTRCGEVVERCVQGKLDEAKALVPDMQRAFDKLEISLGELGERIEKDADTAVELSSADADFAKQFVLGGSILGAALALVLGAGIAKRIVRPLDAAVGVLESGDMSALASVKSDDEIGRMAKAISATVQRMERDAAELANQTKTIEANATQMQAEARKAEESAQRAESLAAEAARVAAMVENSPACMLYADDSMTVRYLNPATRRTLERLGNGWNAARIENAPLDTFYKHPRGNQAFFSVDANLPFRTQTAIGKDAVELVVSAIHDQHHRRIGTLVSWEIVTEKLEAQRRAAASAAEAARVASMVENAPGCMMYADRELVLRYLNPSAKAQLARLGLRAEALLGASLDAFWKHPEGNKRCFGDASRLPWSDEVEFGREIVRLGASAIGDQNGEMIGLMLSWEIVTERIASERHAKELSERELRQAQETQAKVERLLVAVDKAAKGDLTTRIDVTGDDAIGRTGAALARLLGDLRVSISRIRENAQKLADSSVSLNDVSQRMSSEAEQTANQAHLVADVASRASNSMQTVSQSTDGMSQSITEIARSASAAARVARTAVETAEATNSTVTQLDRSSEEIGKILKTITTIAQQTNLLALNATIEAARAGEMGRGFAVVANEVKELAKETAKATTDITSKIEAMQTGSRGAVDAISKIGAIIKEIDGLQTTIAAAVEEQTTATRDITRNVSEASASSRDITANMEQVATAARETSNGATNSLGVAGEVSRMADELLAAVGQFRC